MQHDFAVAPRIGDDIGDHGDCEESEIRHQAQAREAHAKESGGEVVELNALDSFVAGLPNRKIPLTESWTYPLWHQWQVFLIALACLVGEWGLRRWKGLP